MSLIEIKMAINNARTFSFSSVSFENTDESVNMEKISNSTELSFCCVCQEEWTDILSKPKPIPIEYKWKTSQDCDHKCCTACYSRILFGINEDGKMSTKTARNCPYCRAEISNKHLDEGITLSKKLLLKYFFVANQAYSSVMKAKQTEKLHQQHETINRLIAEKKSLDDEIKRLQENKVLYTAKNNSLSEFLDDSNEKCEFYKEASSRDRVMNHHAHLLLEHCYHSMEDMKRKHLSKLKTQQRDNDILVEQIKQEKKEVNQLHNQILVYQNELVAKATRHRVDAELKDVELSVLRGSLMNKFTDIQQGFMPLHLTNMLEKHMKVLLSNDICDVAQNSYLRGIINIASLKLVQNKLLTKPCVRDEILNAIIKHLKEEGHADCHALIEETRNSIKAINTEHEHLTNLAFLHKLDRCDADRMIDFKIPQAYLPHQLLKDDPNVLNYIQDAVKQKEKVLLEMAKRFKKTHHETNVAKRKIPEEKTQWLCSLKKRKITKQIETEHMKLITESLQPATSTTDQELTVAPPPPPPSPTSPARSEEGASMVLDCCSLSAKERQDEQQMHIPLGAVIDITREFIEKKKEAVEMVKQMHNPLTDAKLNKMVCLNYNCKFFDSDVHLCDREFEDVESVGDFINKLCPLEHRCTFVMKCGSLCFSKFHTHVQHAMYWDMPSFDVQRAFDVGAITNNELTQIIKLHEEKHNFHHELLSKNLGFCNVSKLVNMDSYYFARKKSDGTVDHGKFNFTFCNSPVWNVIDSVSTDDEDDDENDE